MVHQKNIIRKEDIKKFEQHHQDTNNPNDLDVIFGDDWSDKIHEIPTSNIWGKEIGDKFLEFIMKKKDDASDGETGSSTVPANVWKPSQKSDSDFKPLLVVNSNANANLVPDQNPSSNRAVFRNENLEKLLATHRPQVVQEFFTESFLKERGNAYTLAQDRNLKKSIF